jgi:DNA-binding GntR family transcriptional regulator
VALAERFSMSRTPIREALVRLEGEGLITTLPNRSTMVSNIDFLNLGAFLDAIVLLYRLTGRQAALNHDAKDLVTIRARQAEFAAAVASQNALAMIATNREFHIAVAEAGGNIYYTQLFKRLLDEGRRILRLYYQSFDDRLPQQFVDEHDELIAAIAARDVDAAERISKVHADQIVMQVQKLFSRDQGQEITL